MLSRKDIQFPINIPMRFLLFLISLFPLLSLGSGLVPCDGSVLERRLALAEAGELAGTYIAENGELDGFCSAYAQGGTRQASPLLDKSLTCESSEKDIVYYTCELSRSRNVADGRITLILESCSYVLDSQSISCENNAVVTTFAE